jgi:phage terminase large subunit-like protein
MNILEALDDENLFAPYFSGQSWASWRAFLAALFALPMDAAAAAIYRAATGRHNCPALPFNEAALIVGRRGGKSRVLATIAVFLATFRDYAQFLAPGEVATVAVLAANRAQARTIFRYVLGLLRGVPMLSSMIVGETEEAIELSNGVVIEIGTASFRTIRGYSFAAILCDESAFWRDETRAESVQVVSRAGSSAGSYPQALK